MLEQEVLDPEELTTENLESFFEDETFVDYFNTFLALPCFAERLFYNIELGLFEEFIQKLADEVDDGDAQAASQLRKYTHFKGTIYNMSSNETRIGYYVTILDKVTSYQFVLEHRMPLFLKSELYAEYKLTIILSTVQASLIGDFTGEEEINSRFSRRQSVVSFNLGSGERQNSAGSKFNERNADSPHIRSIEETFTAWQDSFRQADSRASLYSYAEASPMPITPEIREPESDSDSMSSAFDNEELDEDDSNARPQSRMSYLSDVTSISAESVIGSQVGSVDTTLEEDMEIDENGNIIESGSYHGDGFEKQMPRQLNDSEDGIEQMPREEEEPGEKGIEGTAEEQTDGVKVNDEQKESAEETLEREVESDSHDVIRSSPGEQSEPVLEEGQVLTSVEPVPSSPDDESKEEQVPSLQEGSNIIPEESVQSLLEGNNNPEESVQSLPEGKDKDKSNLTSPRTNENEHTEVDGHEMSQLDFSSEPIEVFNDNQYTKSSPSVIAVETILEEAEEMPSELASDVTAGHVPSIGKLSINDLEVISERSAESGTTPSDVAQSDISSQSSHFKSVSSDICRKCGGTLRDISESKSNISSEQDTSEQENTVKICICGGNLEIDAMSETLSGSTRVNSELQALGEEDEDEEVSSLTRTPRDEEVDGPRTVRYDIKSPTNDKDNSVADVDEEETKQEGEGGAEVELGESETNSVFTLQGIRGILSANKRRASIAATSIGFDLDQQDSDYDDEEDDEDYRPYDLSTKDGMDEFKKFLLGTNAEKYLRLWMDVECGKHLEHEQEKNSITQVVRERYWSSGGLHELSTEAKKRLELEIASKVTYPLLMKSQHWILEPLMSYWCPRFTMHQQRRRIRGLDTEYTRLVKERPKTCVRRENELSNVPREPLTCGLTHVTCRTTEITCTDTHITCSKEYLRPQSCRAPRPVTAKAKMRAKSAHPRLIPAHTPIHTNASTAQLQNITAPLRTGYGFAQVKPPTYPTAVLPEYHSTVRLFINPVPTPDGKVQRMLRLLHKTAVSPSNPQTIRCAKERRPETSEDKMESLIEGLILEKQTGGYFEAFIRRLGNKKWIDCLEFWKALQEYNAYFFADALNPLVLAKKAKLMYAKFVVGGGMQAIGLSNDVQEQVAKQLDPPYEELFDAVEDHALHCLLEAWALLNDNEDDSYRDVAKEQKVRHLELKILPRRRRSVVHTNQFDASDDDIEKDKISIEEANRPMPVPKDGFSFESLIRNRTEIEHFKEFLNKKHSRGIKDLMAWTDMETFRRIPRFMNEKRDKKSSEVRNSWLTKKYFFGHDSPATREGQNMIMNVNGGRAIKERPTSPVITESQKFVRARIERRWLMLFKQTAEFLDRQKPKVAAPEIVEDVLLKRRLQRSEAAWKILNSRWVSSSRDVVALRNQLLNPVTCAEFKTYVALKGDTFENDVDFWLEVQKYKDLCHTHAHDGLIRRKVHAITECYLNSAITPELQIDIPIEMAEKLLERLTARHLSIHPYIFREAQMTVFRVLFNHWKEFNSYRSKAPVGESLLSHLSEQLKKQRADVRAKRETSERRRQARMSAEKRKKDKEERERKRIEDLSSLFSLETASIFYSEEDEVQSWHYSKHRVEEERQEHIRRLREQGIIVPDDAFLEIEKEDTKSRRSRVSATKSSQLETKSSLKLKNKSLSVVDSGSDKKSSERSGSVRAKLLTKLKKQYAGQVPQSPLAERKSSIRSQSPSMFSATRRNSTISQKSARFSGTGKEEKKIGELIKDAGKGSPPERADKHDQLDSPKGDDSKKNDKCESKPSCKAKQTKDVKSKVAVAEIQVMPLLEPATEDDDMNEFTRGLLLEKDTKTKKQEKLLSGRAQKTKRLLLYNAKALKSAGKKRVPLDAISCISDYSEFSNIDYLQKRPDASAPNRPDGAATPLTFKSLKDFTDSPEGAPLAVPLPLVRITSASHKDVSDGEGSQGDPALASFRPRPQHLITMSSRYGSARTRRRRLGNRQGEPAINPDVIVN